MVSSDYNAFVYKIPTLVSLYYKYQYRIIKAII